MKITVALVQMAMSDDLSANDTLAEKHIREAAQRGARLICLPELFRSRYFCQIEDSDFCDLAESIPGPSTERFGRLAAELKVTLVLSLFERRAPGLYHNTAVVMDRNGRLAGMYRKMHIPDDPRYYEKFYFTPGDLGFNCIEADGVRLGVLVCWDQWYPEAARLMALDGAQLLIYPTAIGWHPQEKALLGAAQRDAWRTIQRSHAIANGCHVLSINRCGFEPTPSEATKGIGSEANSGIEFWGSSFVAAPDGSVLTEAGESNSSILVTTLDLAEMERQRRGWPYLRDRRIDAYAELTKRYRDG